jgi:hypothetical protein
MGVLRENATARCAPLAINKPGKRALTLLLAWGIAAQMLPTMSCLTARAETPQQSIAGEGTSSRAAREEAARAIPGRQMAPNDRQTAQFMIKNASMFRRLPTRIIDCDPDLFTFLIQRPEVVIDIWRVMGISQVALNRMPDGSYQGTDGAGTTGTVRYLCGNWGGDAQNTAVVYAEGAYEGAPFLTKIKAQSLLLVRSNAVQETNGRNYVTVRIDSFVRLEQVGVELMAKTVQPWISKTADRNLIETLTFVSNFSRAAEKNPQGVERLAKRLSSIDEPTRHELVQICFRTAERYALRDQPVRSRALLANRSTVD